MLPLHGNDRQEGAGAICAAPVRPQRADRQGGLHCPGTAFGAGTEHLATRITVLKGSTTSQLRDDIDHGRTGDKVDALDPTVAPLGTDEEAAGTPPDPCAGEAARTLELSRPRKSTSRPGLGAAWLLIAFVFALGVGLVAWGLLLHG